MVVCGSWFLVGKISVSALGGMEFRKVRLVKKKYFFLSVTVSVGFVMVDIGLDLVRVLVVVWFWFCFW